MALTRMEREHLEGILLIEPVGDRLPVTKGARAAPDHTTETA